MRKIFIALVVILAINFTFGLPIENHSSSNQEFQIESAKFWLREARRNPKPYMIDFVYQYLKRAEFKPEDIGTSQQELTALDVKAHIESAKYWLQSARQFPRLFMIDLVYLNVKEAGVEFEDIGISEPELIVLAIKTHILKAEYWIKNAPDAPLGSTALYLELADQHIEEANALFEKLRRMLEEK